MILMVSWAAFAQDTITIGYFDDPPHIFTSEGRAQGALVDYWEKEIAGRMGVTVQWLGPFPPGRLFSMLGLGQLNAIALLSKTNQRAALFDYPVLPFQKINAGIAVRLNSPLVGSSLPNSMKNRTVTFFVGGFIPPSVERVADISWDLLSSNEWKVLGLRKVLNGRAEAVFDPDWTTLLTTASLPEFQGKFQVLKIPDTAATNYTVFSRKDSSKFLNLYNRAITTMSKNSSEGYVTFLETWIAKP